VRSHADRRATLDDGRCLVRPPPTPNATHATGGDERKLANRVRGSPLSIDDRGL
jgi:hypothetical protein